MEPETVDDIVVGRRKVGNVESVAQGEIHRPALWHSERGVIRDSEVNRHRGHRNTNFDRDVVIVDDETNLLTEIVREGRAGHGR